MSVRIPNIPGILDPKNEYPYAQLGNTLYVDGKRLDNYTPNGSWDKPFKTINEAYAAIFTDFENVSTIYILPGVYTEDVNLTEAAPVAIVGQDRGTCQLTGVVTAQSCGMSLTNLDINELHCDNQYIMAGLLNCQIDTFVISHSLVYASNCQIGDLSIANSYVQMANDTQFSGDVSITDDPEDTYPGLQEWTSLDLLESRDYQFNAPCTMTFTPEEGGDIRILLAHSTFYADFTLSTGVMLTNIMSAMMGLLTLGDGTYYSYGGYPVSDYSAPSVESVVCTAPNEIVVTYTEAVNAQAQVAANYTLSGAGMGTLTETPDLVTQLTPDSYQLTWSSGVMLEGNDITITVANIADPAGNPAVPPLNGTDTGGAQIIPLLPVMSVEEDPSAEDPIILTVTFPRAVSDFAFDDFTVRGCTVNHTIETEDDTVFLVTLEATDIGEWDIDIKSHACTDEAGNENEVPEQFHVTFTPVALIPVVTIYPDTPDPATDDPMAFVITFPRDVTEFVDTDITIGNGTSAGLVPVDAKTYVLAVNPTTIDDVTINIDAAVCIGPYLEDNEAAEEFVWAFEPVAFTPVVTSDEPDPSSSDPIEFTITFPRVTMDFAVGDLTLINCTVADFSGSDDIYTVSINPTTVDQTGLSVADTVCTGPYGEDNLESNELTISFEPAEFLPVIETAEPDPGGVASFDATITFPRNVTDFIITDITAVNADLSAFGVVENVATVTVTPTGEGNLTLDVAADVCVGPYSEPNTEAVQFLVEIVELKPLIEVPEGEPEDTFEATITFPREVADFVVGDITAGNATLDNFATLDNIIFTVDVTPDGTGNISLDVAAAKCTGVLWGEDNVAADQVVVVLSAFKPVFTCEEPDPTAESTFEVTVTFPRPTVDFNILSIDPDGATLDNFTDVGGEHKVFTVDVTPTEIGDVSLEITAASCTGPFGETNLAADPFEIEFSPAALEAVITTEETNPTANDPIAITITWPREVTGFTEGDLTLTGCTVDNWTDVDGEHIIFTCDLIPEQVGEINVDIAAEKCTGPYSENNVASDQFGIIFTPEGTFKPVITCLEEDPTSTTPFEVTITFPRATYGDFEDTDITVGNGAAGNLQTADDTVYTADITPVTDGLVTVNIGSDVCTSIYAEDNEAALQFSITYAAL